MQPPFHIALSGTYVAEVCDAVGFLDFLQKPEVTRTKIVVTQKKTEEAKANVGPQLGYRSYHKSVFSVSGKQAKGGKLLELFPEEAGHAGHSSNEPIRETDGRVVRHELHGAEDAESCAEPAASPDALDLKSAQSETAG